MFYIGRKLFNYFSFLKQNEAGEIPASIIIKYQFSDF